MNRFIPLFVTLAGTLSMSAQSEIVVLDLTKATSEMTFDEVSGRWNATYDEDAECIESQCFLFLHNCISDWNTWWGFTASASHDNSRQENTLDFQWSNMAQGGIELNDDNTVKLDENGTPVVNAEIPYLVSFAADNMYGPHSASMLFNDGKMYEPVGVYVNLNSYTYYCIEYGDAFARAFRNGDSFKLTVHGVAADESEKTVEASLASYSNGDLTINRGWKYVDLSELGAVNELYFTLETTDMGAYGANTPLYFCMDKLMVKPADNVSVNMPGYEASAITYDRVNRKVNIGDAEFASVYDCTGKSVMSTDSRIFSVESLPAGVYVVRTANSVLKIAR